MTIKKILRKYSNGTISNVSGYPIDFICQLRKNRVHEHLIVTKHNISMPVKSVMENRIVKLFGERKL